MNDNVILQDVQRIKERGKKLGILKGNAEPTMGDLLYVDVVWRALNISHDLDTVKLDFEIEHKKLLQYGNLSKILVSHEQIRGRRNPEGEKEGAFTLVVKNMMEKERATKSEKSKKTALERKKKFTEIATKVVNGLDLTEDEQEIYEAGIEAANA